MRNHSAFVGGARDPTERLLSKKKKAKQGGDWYFSAAYPDKFTFVRKLYKVFKNVTADITISTNQIDASEVLKSVLERIKPCGVSGSV